ncbi:Ribosomal protein S12 methylthiotransferase RimO [Pelotomaculum schinkii]|uniref:Ribosomal protein S12 methylthiotransferase RimO n=1 Tax=Pelotomaculum schinkii TaxID=78350 RepID=A0A4Y7RBT4_9FIRM|nr:MULTISPECIES: radical SAM protein [Pelotomaculum]TEB05787.1 Ribosomal protein S12 methylthiotransferase RimO [Pelotomaculum schinkii]TEB17954.1 Ribosomal protein S12 methylthiotransferase RimO [Pelotomaculum sp. FP]
MADVVLVNPIIPSWYTEVLEVHPEKDWLKPPVGSPPLGLLYIAAYLVSRGYKVKVLDIMRKKIKKSEFIGFLEQEQPKIVGLVVFSEATVSVFEFCSSAKEWNPNVITVLGGPHVTFMDEETLQHEAVDIIVRGEGELSMAELADYFLQQRGSLNEIKGITYKMNTGKDVEIVRNPGRPYIKELDQLPFPLRTAIDMEEYPMPGTIITSRGCPGSCIFCAAGAISGGRYRTRGIDNVILEIEEMRRIFKIDYITVVDDTFTAFPERTRAFCHYYNKSNSGFAWGCESRVDDVSRELLTLMVESGCDAIQFGVESGVQSVLYSIRKNITVEQIEVAVRWAREAGIRFIACSFIIGHHSDTHDTVRQTLEFAKHLRDSYGVTPFFGMCTPYPGTYLYRNREKLGVTIYSKGWDTHQLIYSNISTKYLTRQDIQRWYYKASELFRDDIKKIENIRLRRSKHKSQSPNIIV